MPKSIYPARAFGLREVMSEAAYNRLARKHRTPRVRRKRKKPRR